MTQFTLHSHQSLLAYMYSRFDISIGYNHIR